MTLREKAIDAMNGRAWYDGPVKIEFTLFAPQLEYSLNDFFGGITDTLDGSHGFTFTYLPVVYQDDCQVAVAQSHFVESTDIFYELRITFLET